MELCVETKQPRFTGRVEAGAGAARDMCDTIYNSVKTPVCRLPGCVLASGSSDRLRYRPRVGVWVCGGSGVASVPGPAALSVLC
jgi:hypothetical protein